MNDKAANTRTAPLWLLFATLFGGLALFQGRADRPAGERDREVPRTGVKTTKSNEPLSPLHLIRQPLARFLGVDVQDITDEKDLETRLPERLGRCEFLVVMVADPIDTQVNYRFDLQIETIHRALSTERYVPDAYYLPWQKDAGAARYDDIPGVLLYRRDVSADGGGKADLLVVYLVGEVPTTGIHKPAFRRALEEVAALSKAIPGTSRNLKICGPVFSGSAYSLAISINKALEQESTAFDFQVITGSATAIARDHFLELARRKNAGSDSKATGSIDFRAAVHSSTSLEAALIRHVAERNLGPLKIGWLREGGTGYGSVTRQHAPRTRRPTDRASQQPSAGAEDNRKSDPPVSKSHVYDLRDAVIDSTQAVVIDFTIPFTIARVRSTYENERRSDDAVKTKVLPDPYRLTIPFDDSGTAKDLPPTQTPNMTAPAEEMMLNQIFAAIRNEGIEYVGISMTDVRDPIFLAQMVRDHCPSAQILIVASDLLHLHTEYRAALAGALVASSYSLCPNDQDWCFPFEGRKRKVVYSNQSFYGMHNAIILLRSAQQFPEAFSVERGVLELDSMENQAKIPHLLAYGDPLAKVEGKSELTFRPPVWISMISPTGIWPLQAYPENQIALASSPQRSPTPPAGRDGHPKAEPAPDSENNQLSQPWTTFGVSLNPKSWNDIGGLEPSFDDRISPSSMFVMWAWVIAGFVYLLALFGKAGGNWIKPVRYAIHPELTSSVESMRTAFRMLLSASLASVCLLEFALLTVVLFPWTSADDMLHRVVHLALWLCSGAAAAMLLIAIVRDLLKLLWLVPAWIAKPAETAPRNKSLLVRAAVFAFGGIVSLAVLVVVFRYSSGSRPHLIMWYIAWTDLWNGISLLLSANLTAAALIVLAYGFLLQIDLTHGDNLILPPAEGLDIAAGPEEMKSVRRLFIFPILTRRSKDRSILVPVVCFSVLLAWLITLWFRTEDTEFFSHKKNIVNTIFLLACLLWCWRFFKVLVLTQDFAQFLEETANHFGIHRTDRWDAILKRNHDPRLYSLYSLFWTRRPKSNEPALLARCEELQGNLDSPEARENVFAQRVILFVRQFFVHSTRLMAGLAMAAVILFLTATSFPFNTEPLLQLTTSLMLVACGTTLLWYYMVFDRDLVLSHIVGSTPHQLDVWSLLHTAVPACGLLVIAFLGQAFPEMWHWLRNVLEPIARTSS